tara:strand:+ start:2877 stop:3626 length:750 start_codon:yes stop_codon:yes gene_type:complete
MIYVNGDSWSMSSSGDNSHVWPNYDPDLPMWPNMLAKDLDQELINESMGCGSNSRIVDCLEDILLCNHKPNFIVLALSCFHRWHLPTVERGHWVIGPLVALNTVTGKKDEYIQKWFYANCDDYLDSVFRHYKTVWQLVNLCEQIGSKYVVFNTWDEDIYKLNLFQSNNKIENFVTDFYKNDKGHPARQRYIQAFTELRKLSKSWNYFEKPLAKILSPEHLKQNDGHPNKDGNTIIKDYIKNYILQQEVI